MSAEKLQWVQVGWLMCTDGRLVLVGDEVHGGRCPDCEPVFVRRGVLPEGKP